MSTPDLEARIFLSHFFLLAIISHARVVYAQVIGIIVQKILLPVPYKSLDPRLLMSFQEGLESDHSRNGVQRCRLFSIRRRSTPEIVLSRIFFSKLCYNGKL